MTIAEYRQIKPRLTTNDKEKIRRDITDGLRERAKENPQTYHPPLSLLDSKPYRKILTCVECRKAIAEDLLFWEQLRKEISLLYPSFIDTILILSDDNIPVKEIRLLMLIKCGITPAQTCILLSREKGTVSYYRKKLCTTLFGNTVPTKNMDKLIHCI
ncbi:MAG: hypothetical protein K2G90_06865 [Muribaculaceae bacterium]|nr:hypothetical protein [Muribaculaceae bacterium]